MKKLAILFVAMVASGALWAANNVITYTASSKLNETTNQWSGGLHTNAFNVAVTSHIFSDGTGTITFAGEVTSIGDRAFYKCSTLSSITIPNSVTRIGNWAFEYCSTLSSIAIPNSLTSIGSSAFASCSSLTSITIPNSVTSIGDYSFYYCTSLQSITIPNSVTSIGSYAFEDCTSLTSITIPNSVTRIGEYAFSKCSSLISFTVDAANTHYVSVDGVLFNYAKDTLIQYPIGNKRTTYTIPNSVTSIGNSAFYYCESLSSVTIPNSVTSIGYNAFSNCTSLSSVTIPNSVTSIGSSAFYYCISLSSITIPESVTSIGSEAFYGCTSLPVENNLRYADTYLVGAIEKTLSTYTIKTGTKWIGTYAFEYCSTLSSITIPNSVTSIGENAFFDCPSLTSITIPNSVTSIGDRAFSNCTSLTSITIGNNVTRIGKYAFSDCTSLTSITVDAANTHFASVDGVLFNYAKDTLIQYPIGNKRTTYTIPNSVTNIGEQAFSSCTSLSSITIPNSVTSIGNSAFDGCSSLSSINVDAANTHYASVDGVLFNYAKDTLIQCPVGNTRTTYTIPNSVTSIGNEAFSWCTSLCSITIPNSVTSIGDGAFFSCHSLTSITCYTITPPTCGYYCFYYVTKSIPLYVPEGSINAYKDADVWEEFTNIKAAPDVPSDLEQLTDSPIHRLNKIMKDGQVVILQDGHRYDFTGKEVK